MPNASNRDARAPAPTTARRGAHHNWPGRIHLAVMSLYAAAGIGAAVSLYRRMLDLIEDPLPAAMLTLTAALIVLVFTNGGERRR